MLSFNTDWLQTRMGLFGARTKQTARKSDAPVQAPPVQTKHKLVFRPHRKLPDFIKAPTKLQNAAKKAQKQAAKAAEKKAVKAAHAMADAEVNKYSRKRCRDGWRRRCPKKENEHCVKVDGPAWKTWGQLYNFECDPSTSWTTPQWKSALAKAIRKQKQRRSKGSSGSSHKQTKETKSTHKRTYKRHHAASKIKFTDEQPPAQTPPVPRQLKHAEQLAEWADEKKTVPYWKNELPELRKERDQALANPQLPCPYGQARTCGLCLKPDLDISDLRLDNLFRKHGCSVLGKNADDFALLYAEQYKPLSELRRYRPPVMAPRIPLAPLAAPAPSLHQHPVKPYKSAPVPAPPLRPIGIEDEQHYQKRLSAYRQIMMDPDNDEQFNKALADYNKAIADRAAELARAQLPPHPQSKVAPQPHTTSRKLTRLIRHKPAKKDPWPADCAPPKEYLCNSCLDPQHRPTDAILSRLFRKPNGCDLVTNGPGHIKEVQNYKKMIESRAKKMKQLRSHEEYLQRKLKKQATAAAMHRLTNKQSLVRAPDGKLRYATGPLVSKSALKKMDKELWDKSVKLGLDYWDI